MFSWIHCTGQFAEERESVIHQASDQPVIHDVREIDRRGIVQIVLHVSHVPSHGLVNCQTWKLFTEIPKKETSTTFVFRQVLADPTPRSGPQQIQNSVRDCWYMLLQ